MYLIDANRTLGPLPNGQHSFLDEDSLLADMDTAGIDEAFVTLSWQRLIDPRDEDLFADAAALGSPRLTTVPSFMPGHPATDVALEELARQHPLLRCANWPGMDSLGSSTRELWGRLDDVGAAVAVDVEGIGWDALEQLVVKYPRIKTLALGTGYRAIARILAVAQASESVWFEMGTLVSAGSVEYLTGEIGAHRLVFGTGAPQRDSGGPTNLLRHSHISDSDRELIAAGNLRKLVARA